MGTLFEQQPRSYAEVRSGSLDEFLTEAAKLAAKHKITIEAVIEARRVLELERQNTLKVHDGDAKDEQLADFGELLQQLIAAIEKLSDR